MTGSPHFSASARSPKAADQLAGREQQLAHTEKQAKAAIPELLDALAAAQDERAQHAANVLGQRSPDRDLIRALIIGTAAADATELHRLHQLAALTGPDTAQIAAAAEDVRKARIRVEDARTGDAGDALTRADLLDRTLALHGRRPDEHACPVCQTADVLDAAWAQQATAQVVLLREQAATASVSMLKP